MKNELIFTYLFAVRSLTLFRKAVFMSAFEKPEGLNGSKSNWPTLFL